MMFWPVIFLWEHNEEIVIQQDLFQSNVFQFSATTDCKPANSLHDVFRATILAKIRYCAPARSGLCSASDRARLDALLRRSKKYGYCADDVPTTVTELFATADQSLFKRVLSNEHHVLQPLLPDKTINRYKLRPRISRQTI